MFELSSELRERDRPVRVGVIGAGQFGTSCLVQIERIRGLRTVAVADSVLERAEAAYDEAGIRESDRETVADAGAVDAVVADGRRALVADGDELATADVDVILESTGDPIAGSRHAFDAIHSGTHVVTATVETDATVGPALAELADTRGVVYTMAYGDQPALITELVAWARTIGLDVVTAGRGISSYDANAAIELCATANATGLPPDVDGLHAPTVTVDEIPSELRPTAAGGCLTESGVVDGAVSPADENRMPGESIADGVFVVVTTPDDSAREFIRQKNSVGAYATADGRYLAFFRPHHLPGAETPVSIASAAAGRHTGTPDTHVADVVARTDEPIDAGTTIEIDYPRTNAPITAELERADAAAADGSVPFALLDGAELTRPLDAGKRITDADVELADSFLRHLRSIWDAK